MFPGPTGNDKDNNIDRTDATLGPHCSPWASNSPHHPLHLRKAPTCGALHLCCLVAGPIEPPESKPAALGAEEMAPKQKQLKTIIRQWQYDIDKWPERILLIPWTSSALPQILHLLQVRRKPAQSASRFNGSKASGFSNALFAYWQGLHLCTWQPWHSLRTKNPSMDVEVSVTHCALIGLEPLQWDLELRKNQKPAPLHSRWHPCGARPERMVFDQWENCSSLLIPFLSQATKQQQKPHPKYFPMGTIGWCCLMNGWKIRENFSPFYGTFSALSPPPPPPWPPPLPKWWKRTPPTRAGPVTCPGRKRWKGEIYPPRAGHLPWGKKVKHKSVLKLFG